MAASKGLGRPFYRAFLIAASIFKVCPAYSMRGRAGITTSSRQLPESVWKPCANEGEAVSKSGLVRFGFSDSWVFAEITEGSECSSSTFNGQDPKPFIQKVCECAEGTLVARNVKDELGVAWERCASEGEDCSCDSGLVRYGEGRRWASIEIGARSDPVSCISDSFGEDPSLGHMKACWCALATNAKDPQRVAIVMLSRHPADLKTWLLYHLRHVKVDHIFISAEDSPDVKIMMEEMPEDVQSKVTLWSHEQPKPPHSASLISLVDTRPSDDYTALQARQVTAMKRAKQLSEEMNIDWLIHIDDDELLYAPQHRTIGDLLASVSEDFQQAYIPNVEAVYSSSKVENCFAETNKVNLNGHTFQGYVNGKAAIRVSDKEAYPAGPHQWRDSSSRAPPKSLHMDKEPFGSPFLVVHYESCPFSRWEDKYWELGNTSPDKIRHIPFAFYRQSIEKMQKCRKLGAPMDSENSLLPECSQDELETFWSSWKTDANPRYRPQDLMPLRIPWDDILRH